MESFWKWNSCSKLSSYNANSRDKLAPEKFRGDFHKVKEFVQHYERLCIQNNVTSDQEKMLKHCSDIAQKGRNRQSKNTQALIHPIGQSSAQTC